MKRPNITPGPWTTRMADCVYSDAKGRFIADCERTPFDKRPAPPDEQDRVNAKAIAAVPELLAALEEAQELIKTARQYFPKSIKNADSFKLELTSASVSKALTKAGYDFP